MQSTGSGMLIARLHGNDGRSVGISWLNGELRAGADPVSGEAMLTWDRAGYLGWVSPETRSWFLEANGVRPQEVAVGQAAQPSVSQASAAGAIAGSDVAGKISVVTALVGLTANAAYSFLSTVAGDVYQYRYVFDGLGHAEWALCGASIAAGIVGKRSSTRTIGLVLGGLLFVRIALRFGSALLISLR
jgi:hypothetical protein